MTLNELDKLLEEISSNFTKNSTDDDDTNHKKKLNPKENSKKEEEKTENKPHEITVRFIKKINP